MGTLHILVKTCDSGAVRRVPPKGDSDGRVLQHAADVVVCGELLYPTLKPQSQLVVLNSSPSTALRSSSRTLVNTSPL